MVMSVATTVATAVGFTITGRSRANPGVAGAAVVAVTDDTVDPVNGAAAVIVANAGAFAGIVVGFGGGDGCERAKAKNGGEEERAEFHDFRGVDCLFVFEPFYHLLILGSAEGSLHSTRPRHSYSKIFSFLEKFRASLLPILNTTYTIERNFAATAFANAV